MTDTLDTAPAALADIPRAPTQDGPAVRLYIVDGSGFIFRAYHALPPLTRKSDGLPVGAVAGFCNMLWKLLVDMKAAPDAPTHLAVVFDHSEIDLPQPALRRLQGPPPAAAGGPGPAVPAGARGDAGVRRALPGAGRL